MPEKLKTIRVQPTSTDQQVVLHERHPDHPAEKVGRTAKAKPHEVFIVNDGKVYEVAETPTIKRLIGEGVLTTNIVEPPKDLPDDEEVLTPKRPLPPISRVPATK
jgi:hypothetical protein